MKFRLPLCVVLIFSLIFSLCGCEIFPVDTDELLNPPALTGDYAPIERALKKAVSGKYSLRYPATGNYRSAFVMQDVNADGRQEAFAFYSKADDEIHINLLCRDENKNWYSADDLTVTAGDVEVIEFFDLNQDGIKEILVGWDVLAMTDKQLGIYGLADNRLKKYHQVSYTQYLNCDLDSDGQNELFVQTVNTNEMTNRATVYRATGETVKVVAECELDCHVQKICSQTVSRLSNKQPAVYIDELKSAGAVTEVLFMRNGALVNPLLEYTTTENVRTVRAASLMCADVDGDGELEIPTAQELPTIDAQAAEKAYYTVWCSFNGRETVPEKRVILNQTDGYGIEVSEVWFGRLAVQKNSEKRLMKFYAVNEAGLQAQELFELAAYETSEWDSEQFNLPDGFEECLRNETTVIAGKVIPSASPLAVATASLKQLIFWNE